MHNRKIIASAFGIVVSGSLLAAVHADTLLPPVATAAHCADGSCIPNRATNGFYATRWRKWPVSPPAPPSKGVREGIPAPDVELPPLQEETSRPRPQAVPSDVQPVPSGPEPTVTPPTTTPPTTFPPGQIPESPAPSEALPPELRGQRTLPQIPRDDRPPRRTPVVAERPGARTATAVEELRANLHSPRDAGTAAAASKPRELPASQTHAAPIQRPFAAGGVPAIDYGTLPSGKVPATLAPSSQATPRDYHQPADSTEAGQAILDEHASSTSGLEAEQLAADAAMFRETEVPAGDDPLDATARRYANMLRARPAAVARGRTVQAPQSKSFEKADVTDMTGSVQQVSAVAELKLDGQASASLALRPVGEDQGAEVEAAYNPLRSNRGAARTSEARPEVQFSSAASAELAIDVPVNNPLRRK